jgi:putative DNA primase/helicase
MGMSITAEARAILEVPDLLSPLHNDYGNSQRLVAMYGNDLRYCHEMRKWIHFDSRRWKPDTTGEACRLAKKAMLEFVRQAFEVELTGDEEADKDVKALRSFAIGSLNERRISHLLILAQSEIYVEPHHLDAHPLLLNVLNGTLNLETGELRPHRREDYLTKLVHVEYHPDAKCPRFRQFIREVLHKNLHGYIQRAFGYSLTGTTIEKVVFCLHGPGNSGKSTLLTTFHDLIAEYAVLIQADTLMVRKHDTNNTQADLCDLRGARFAHTSECEASQRLSQARLKGITQGMGSIKATRKFENPITFPETHKLWLDTNERPGIANVDDQATFNRLHSIPFSNAIDEDKIDEHLGSKLKKEWEGILAWAVAGAMEYFEKGLDKPPEVETSTEEWRTENDNIGRFIDICCVTGDAFRVRAGAFYSAYRDWAARSGEIAASDRVFSARLIGRGYARKDDNKGRYYQGIAERTEEPTKGEEEPAEGETGE